MRLHTGLRILDRAPHTVQVGADAHWATTVSDLSPEDHAQLLRLGSSGSAAARPRTVAGATAPTASGASAPQAYAPLLAAGLLTDGLPPAPAVPSRLVDDAQVAQLTLLPLLPLIATRARAGRPEASGASVRTGAQVVLDRRSGTVAVVGLGRVGMVVADTLAHAGVGRLVLDDPREVRPADVGVGGLREELVGQSRAQAAETTLARSHPQLQIGRTERDAPDLVVLVFEEVADCLRTVRLLAEGVTHLAVTVREGDMVVGPMVVPGVTACLNCQDLRRAEMEGGWPSLREQLKAQGEEEPSAQDSAVAGVAGALAAAEVLAYLDGRAPATAGADIEISVSTAMPRLRGWSVHPRCGCTEMVRR